LGIPREIDVEVGHEWWNKEASGQKQSARAHLQDERKRKIFRLNFLAPLFFTSFGFAKCRDEASKA